MKDTSIVLTNGKVVTKPKGFAPTPTLSHSIILSGRGDQEWWGRCIREERSHRNVKPLELTVKYY